MIAIPVEIDSLKYLKTDVVKIELQEGKTATIEALATFTDGSEEDVTKPTVTYSNMRTTVQVTVTKQHPAHSRCSLFGDSGFFNFKYIT